MFMWMLHSKAASINKCLCECYTRVYQKLWVDVNVYVNVTHEFVKSCEYK
jgi:hypothetical protein